MKKQILIMLITVSFIVIAAAISAPAQTGLHRARGDDHSDNSPRPKSVKVVNTTAEPVPVTGMTTLAGGTVQAEQSGAWNAGITGTPTVSLSPGASVGINGTPTVQVGNQMANPVLVRDVDNPARQPFTFLHSQNWPNDAQFPNTFLITVPAGKRLVIEQVSVVADVTKFATIDPKVRVSVQTAVRPAGSSTGSAAFYTFKAEPTGSIGASPVAGLFAETYEASAQMRSYSDPGPTVQVIVLRVKSFGAASDNATVSLSGYLIDLP